MIIKIDKIETIKAIDKEFNIITLFSLKKLMIWSKVYVSGYTFGKYQLLPIPQKKELIIPNIDKNIKNRLKNYLNDNNLTNI